METKNQALRDAIYSLLTHKHSLLTNGTINN